MPSNNKTVSVIVLVVGGYLLWDLCDDQLAYGWLMNSGEHAPATMEQETGGYRVKFRTKSQEAITSFVSWEYAESVGRRCENLGERAYVKYSPTNPHWCAVINKDYSGLSALMIGLLKLLLGLAGLIWMSVHMWRQKD